MTKNDFLSRLSAGLADLPQDDIKRVLDYYNEMIEDYKEDGMTEEQAINAVGDIDEIISQVINETSLPKLINERIKRHRVLRAWEIVLLILGSPVWLSLLISVIACFIAVYAVIWSVVVCFYAVVLTFAALALAGIFGSVPLLAMGNVGLAVIFIGIGLMGAGFMVLFFSGSNWVTKAIVNLSGKFLLWVKTLFVRKEKKDEKL